MQPKFKPSPYETPSTWVEQNGWRYELVGRRDHWLKIALIIVGLAVVAVGLVDLAARYGR